MTSDETWCQSAPGSFHQAELHLGHSDSGTQLLLGSHQEDWPLRGARVVHNGPAGSINAYDSRTIHRGLANETTEGRPDLIFCYDRIESPLPGYGTLGSIGTSYQGRMIDILSGARNALVSLVNN